MLYDTWGGRPYILLLFLFAQNFDTGLFFVPPFITKGGTFFEKFF